MTEKDDPYNNPINNVARDNKRWFTENFPGEKGPGPENLATLLKYNAHMAREFPAEYEEATIKMKEYGFDESTVAYQIGIADRLEKAVEAKGRNEKLQEVKTAIKHALTEYPFAKLYNEELVRGLPKIMAAQAKDQLTKIMRADGREFVQDTLQFQEELKVLLQAEVVKKYGEDTLQVRIANAEEAVAQARQAKGAKGRQ